MTHTFAEFGNRIIAAALIDEDGQLWSLPAPKRHGDIMRFACQHGVNPNWPPESQGFITSTGKFVSRFQAHTIALRHGQIDAPLRGKELFSEDLW